MKTPDELLYWTADEVAECLDYWSFLPKREAEVLHNRLYEFLDNAKNPTPLGGDGTSGTVETPDGRLDPDNDDKASHWWSKLTDEQRVAIVKALAKDAPS